MDAALEPRISIVCLHVADIHRSYRFYAEGLGFPTTRRPEQKWIAFKLQGLCFCLYPYDLLADAHLKRRLDAARALDRTIVPAVGFAYNTRHKHEVDEVLELARRAGGTIEKMPEENSWGGYGGWFSDPDGHLWEVAWAADWHFNPDGSLIVT